jgi:hypothetical protein
MSRWLTATCCVATNSTQSGAAQRRHPLGSRRRSARRRRCRRRQDSTRIGPTASDSMIGATPSRQRSDHSSAQELRRTRTPAHKNSGAQEVSAQENVGCQPPSGARCAFVTSGFPIEQHDRLILRLFHGAARSSTGLRPRVAYCRSLPVCSEMPLSAPWAAISSERPRSASATNPTSRLLWSMTGSRLT